MTISRRLACFSPVAILNALVWRQGFSRRQGLTYTQGPRGGLDVYLPPQERRPAPIVFFIYGGGWKDGARDDYFFVGAALAQKGYMVVIADYRLWPQIRYPAFLQDNAAALRWSLDQAAALGGDANRVVLMGHSAGAYNAAMLAMDPRWLGQVGLAPAALRGWIGLAGPYDFLPLDTDMLRDLFQPAGDPATSQPIHYARKGVPECFLAAGSADQTVDPGNTPRLAARLGAVGAPFVTKIYPGVNHALLLGAMAAPLQFIAPVYQDVLEFLAAATALGGARTWSG